MTDLLVLDLETTGLDPNLDPIWEVGALYCDVQPTGITVIRKFNEYKHLTESELERGKDLPASFLVDFTLRHPQMEGGDWGAALSPVELVNQFMNWCGIGKPTLLGAVPSFDDRRLGDLIRWHRHEIPWHYHLVCAENLAAGKLGILPPYKSHDLSRGLGIEPDDYDRHTALGDCWWALDQFAAVYGLEVNDASGE